MTSTDAAPVSPSVGVADRLRARLAELEAGIRRVTAERDEALADVERLRAALAAQSSVVEASSGDEPGTLDEAACRACDGEGFLWVHDIRMDCKRCGGTGRAP
jgi:hypothetical protein